MAYTTIDKGSKYFNTVLYTGTGATQSITGLGFAPDWVWIKDRTNAYGHDIYDVIRTATYRIQSNDASAESTASGLTSFNSDGFTLGSYIGNNTNTANYVSWNWKANGTGVSNTAGSISSTVSANTTSGFSIVSYTGNATAGATVGHGLGSTPKMIIWKNRSVTSGWQVYHHTLPLSSGEYQALQLNLDNASAPFGTKNFMNGTAPTSTLFSVDDASEMNGSGNTIIAYCFAEVKGYSKFGSYTGNGSTDGTFVYTGFKPAFTLIKKSSASGTWWEMVDNKRSAINVMDKTLYANVSDTEYSGSAYNRDFLSNGFKLRNTNGGDNDSGATYIYMAFAENPFVSSKGIPTTAR